MPRKISDPDAPSRVRHTPLAAELAEELRSHREFGQPMIVEERFKTGAVRTSVLWDRWAGIASEDRASAIIQAYRIVEGDEFAGRIALAGGMTYPEAIASGMLPVKIIAALRDEDPATPEQCWRAMIEEGASTLFGADSPELRFSTVEDAEACLRRLSARLPGSEPCWVIIKEPDLRSLRDFDFSD